MNTALKYTLLTLLIGGAGYIVATKLKSNKANDDFINNDIKNNGLNVYVPNGKVMGKVKVDKLRNVTYDDDFLQPITFTDTVIYFTDKSKLSDERVPYFDGSYFNPNRSNSLPKSMMRIFHPLKSYSLVKIDGKDGVYLIDADMKKYIKNDIKITKSLYQYAANK